MIRKLDINHIRGESENYTNKAIEGDTRTHNNESQTRSTEDR